MFRQQQCTGSDRTTMVCSPACSACLQGKRARAKPDQSKAATTARPSQASFTCFHTPAVAQGNIPPHTSRHAPVHQQAATPAPSAAPPQADQLSVTATQEVAPPAEDVKQLMQCDVHASVPNGEDAHAEQQPATQVASSLRNQDTGLSAVPASLPNEASLRVLVSEECLLLPGHTDSSPAAGLVQSAECRAAAPLGLPATPCWQGTPAGAPLTPLSSHPIDALEGSDTTTASTSTTGPTSHALPAHSDLLSAEAEPPLSLGLSNTTVISTHAHLSSQHLGYHASPCRLAQSRSQQDKESWMHSQHSEGLLVPLDADAVMLEMDSDLGLSVSADRLISPASSVASWQRGLSAATSSASSSRSSRLFPTLPDSMPVSVDRLHQHQHESLLRSGGMDPDRLPPLTSSPHADSGLCPSFGPMFASSPLAEAWHHPYQPHHHPHQQQESASHATWPSSTSPQQQPDFPCTEGLSGWSSSQCILPVNTDFVVAAAQLQHAVAQAEQLYRASHYGMPSTQQGTTGGSMSHAGSERSATSGQEHAPMGGCSQQLPSALPSRLPSAPPSALPDSRGMGIQHALRRAVEPAYPVHQPLWVPQGEYLWPLLAPASFLLLRVVLMHNRLTFPVCFSLIVVAASMIIKPDLMCLRAASCCSTDAQSAFCALCCCVIGFMPALYALRAESLLQRSLSSQLLTAGQGTGSASMPACSNVEDQRLLVAQPGQLLLKQEMQKALTILQRALQQQYCNAAAAGG